MSNYSQSFIAFSERRMAIQGKEIRAWVKSDNPLLSSTCREIIDAAHEAQAGK